MSHTPQRPALTALAITLLCAAAILALQLLAELFPVLGDVIRRLPLLPVALGIATAAVVANLVRAR